MYDSRSMADAATHALPLPRELAAHRLPQYRIVAGDELSIEPADFTRSLRLPGDLTVRADGTVDLGRYGRLEASGRTIDQVRGDVVKRLKDESGEPIPVNVSLVEPSGQNFYVIGEVNSPGAYPLKGHETTLDGIIAAGGLTDRADRRAILLNRPTPPEECRIVMPICYRHIVQLGDTSTNYQLQPGDRIYVPSLTFWEEMRQTFFPSTGDRCPRCAPPQYPCPPGAQPAQEMIISEPTLAPPAVVPTPESNASLLERLFQVRSASGLSGRTSSTRALP
jgi:protein involved in polysaccharide export with SLBB domain